MSSQGELALSPTTQASYAWPAVPLPLTCSAGGKLKSPRGPSTTTQTQHVMHPGPLTAWSSVVINQQSSNQHLYCDILQHNGPLRPDGLQWAKSSHCQKTPSCLPASTSPEPMLRPSTRHQQQSQSSRNPPNTSSYWLVLPRDNIALHLLYATCCPRYPSHVIPRSCKPILRMSQAKANPYPSVPAHMVQHYFATYWAFPNSTNPLQNLPKTHC